MTYAGNAALSSAVKDRVTSTFQQTVALYHQGRLEEVTAGCTLILQMDPMFDPARKLLEKTRNPNLPIDVDTLLPRDPRAPMQQAREAMAERDFQRVIHLTTEILTDDLLNDEARILGDEAREKLEASPFVEQFTRKCDQSIAAGNIAAAKMELEKARALDPTHPDVVRIARALAARDSAPSAAAAPISPSFIVDEPAPPPAPGRSAAQAADFGFAFEEEKPQEVSFANFSFDSPAGASADAPFGGFSFDSPSPAAKPAPAPSGSSEFDFATAAIVTTSDDQKKIEQYLADGDRAFDAGDYQQAIDLWSRIFLIDVTNDDASARIERAKAKRRELEQKIEPLLASGVAAFERGDTARAHADLTEVLRLDPQNVSAQDYLDRLEETLQSGAAAPPAIPPSTADDDNLDLGFFEDEPAGNLSEAPLVPPSPAAAALAAKTTGKQAAAPKAASPARKLPMGLIAAILAIVVLGAGGWFVWNRFMNKPEAESSGAGQALIARASMLAKTGKYDQAIALLQDIKPDDPQHDEALVMIADLRAKKASSAELIDGIPAAQYYDQKLAAGLQAFAAHDYAAAKKAFEEAQRVKPLPPDAKVQYDTASQQMAKLDAATALFNERKFTEAIGNLQPLLEQDPQNVAIQKMIVDAHFNLGAAALQEERLPDAIREFDEVLKVNPNDEVAKRSRELAVRYDGQPKDLLYRIYVKYLPLRQAA
ncbi:MAG TPA: tetratricopeptide repeat protein [Thermoanaerobaculia bacterium]|nr:tetratricopeptide repeat protein [Thermoanaerobaculia bacterium]